MRADPIVLAAAAVLAAGACVTRTSPARVAVAGAATASAVDAVVRAALEADAAGAPGADTLYTVDATVVANARMRLRPPRLAGVSYGGRIVVAASNTITEGRFAFVSLDYRWVNVEADNTTAGRATFVCRLEEGRWKILHVHSSQPLPWER